MIPATVMTAKIAILNRRIATTDREPGTAKVYYNVKLKMAAAVGEHSFKGCGNAAEVSFCVSHKIQRSPEQFFLHGIVAAGKEGHVNAHRHHL